MSFPVLTCPECEVELGIAEVAVDSSLDEDGMQAVLVADLECGHSVTRPGMLLESGVVDLIRHDRPDVINVVDEWPEYQCNVCGVESSDDVSVFADPNLDVAAVGPKCEEHARAESAWWWMPGDHPSLFSPDNYPLSCERCGDSLDYPCDGIVGRIEDHRGSLVEETQLCLDCTTPDDLRSHGFGYERGEE